MLEKYNAISKVYKATLNSAKNPELFNIVYVL